jgi:hypothetical protein
MDRGYLDFERLHALHQAGGFFVTRAKSNAKFKRLLSQGHFSLHAVHGWLAGGQPVALPAMEVVAPRIAFTGCMAPA